MNKADDNLTNNKNKQVLQNKKLQREMTQVNLTTTKLSQSQILSENPHSSTISQIKQLKTVLQKELQHAREHYQKLQSQVQVLTKQQHKKQKQQLKNAHQQPSLQNKEQNQPQLKPQQSLLIKKRKQLKNVSIQIQNKQKQLQKCGVRLQLLQLGKNLGVVTPQRLDRLEKIFNHYCHYIFKIGKHVTFDRIEYEKSHLIMERFFAFVHDFHLNKFHDPVSKVQKELIPKHELVLIFKKSSSNSRNLNFSQFITCLQRLAYMRHEFQETYEKRKQQQELQRKRIKQLNLRRQKERERMRKLREQHQERERKEEERKRAEQQERRRKEQEASQQAGNNVNGEQGQVKEQTKEERKERKKREKEKKKKKKQEKGSAPNENQSEGLQRGKSQQNANQTNDDLIKQMMTKDASIANPNQQFNHIQKFKKSPSKAKLPQQPQQTQLQRQQTLTLTKPQRIQLLYNLIDLSNPNSIQQKLRQYEKPMFKHIAASRKQSILNSSSVSKMRQTQMHHQLRLDQLNDKINSRKKDKLRRSMSKSITDEKYLQKKKDDYEKYLHRAKSISSKDQDALEHKTKNSYRKKNQPLPISLNILNQSSENDLGQLKIGYGLKRYLHPQQDDALYLKQYGPLDRLRSSNSSYIQKSPRYSVDLKKRADQMQQEQKRQQQKKLQRFALQMYKNQHYMKRFLERKF